MLAILNTQGAGGSAKFYSLGSRSIGLKQSFDQLLAVGYHALDVPVYENGELGVPVPTFQKLDRGVAGWLPSVLEMRDNRRILNDIVGANPARGIAIMRGTAETIKGREFRRVLEFIQQRENTRQGPDTGKESRVSDIQAHFWNAAAHYVARPNLFRRGSPARVQQFNEAFDSALSRRDPGGPRPVPGCH